MTICACTFKGDGVTIRVVKSEPRWVGAWWVVNVMGAMHVLSCGCTAIRYLGLDAGGLDGGLLECHADT
jgi:hypothetical protein